MEYMTDYLKQSGGQASGTRNMTMGLIDSHTEIHRLITELQDDAKKTNVKMREMEEAARGQGHRGETRSHNSGKPIMEYKGVLDLKTMNSDGYQEWI